MLLRHRNPTSRFHCEPYNITGEHHEEPRKDAGGSRHGIGLGCAPTKDESACVRKFDTKTMKYFLYQNHLCPATLQALSCKSDLTHPPLPCPFRPLDVHTSGHREMATVYEISSIEG